MLGVLAFKQSLFAGVLDGGANEVFLKGTRLSQFMQSVEQVAGAMGEADADVAVESPATPAPAGTVAAAGDLAPVQDIDPVSPAAAASAEEAS